MSGDIDYDKTVAMIDRYFGQWESNPDLQAWTRVEEDPITQPVVKEVLGPDAEWVNIGFRFNGRSSEDYQLLRLTDMILSNSQAGLIDLNLKQQQKVLNPASYVNGFNDYNIHLFTAKPREGQTLEQVQQLLLDQIDLVKKGEFEDWLIGAVINDLKKNKIQQYQYNWARSNDLVMAFTNGIPWNEYVAELDNLRNYTKEDVMKFATEHYQDNYIVIRKRNGKDANSQKVTKPPITKVALNKESVSPFHQKILDREVEKLKPVFVDYDKDISRMTLEKGVNVFYTPNKENDLFTLYYLSDAGTNNDPRLKVAIEYLEYVGTDAMTSEEIQKEFYKLGCDFGVSAASDRTYVYLSGLTENMEEGLQLFETLLNNAKADEEALTKMIDGIFKKRDDSKLQKSAILWQGLINYGLYGPNSSFTNVLGNKDLRQVKAEELIDIIRQFTKTDHRVLYYGPEAEDQLVNVLNTYHNVPDQLQPVPPAADFVIQDMSLPKVYWAHYDMVQEEIIFLAKGEKYDAERIPDTRMFNEYFGGSMASPVFQELREAQGLAYSAFATYATADKKTDEDYFFGYIGTQADKQTEAMKAMENLIQEFPKSENGFEIARKSLLNQIESERITKTSILFNYEGALRKGLDHDVRKDVYERAQSMTLGDVEKFQLEFIKGKKFNIVLVGDKNKINLKELQKYGEVKELTPDELFGYEKVIKINVEAGGN
jgi:predicted Zn-dependent peptidase